MISETTIKAAIRKAEGGKKLTELRDTGGRGEGRLVLAVRLIPPRVTTEWYAVWYRAERRKMAKLGSYPAMSLADARKMFREDYAPEISAGRDPAGPRKRRDTRTATFEDMCKAYVESLSGKPSQRVAHHALLGTPPKPPKAQPKRIRRASDAKPKPARTYVKGAVQTIGASILASEVTPAMIRKHLAAIYDRGAVVQAREARAYLHAAFAYALQSANDYTSAVGLVDWGISHNPVAAIPTDKSDAAHRKGERNLTPAEVRTFWTWLGEASNARLSAVPKLIICTGQRVTEIMGITKDSRDLGESMVDWSKTKNGMPHAIPLPQQATDILDGLMVNGHGLYFPHSQKPGIPAPVDSVEKLVGRFLKAHPDVAHFTPRDLRRTWKTLAGAAGISKEMRDRLQNHARSDVSSRHYDRYDYLVEKRAAMKVWEGYLDRILAGDLDNPVSRLPAAIG